MKFRKKPVTIEAYRWSASDPINKWPSWLLEAVTQQTAMVVAGRLAIKTLEGTMKAEQGDWVIQGVAGELYPCKPSIFEQTYEPVSMKAATP